MLSWYGNFSTMVFYFPIMIGEHKGNHPRKLFSCCSSTKYDIDASHLGLLFILDYLFTTWMKCKFPVRFWRIFYIQGYGEQIKSWNKALMSMNLAIMIYCYLSLIKCSDFWKYWPRFPVILIISCVQCTWVHGGKDGLLHTKSLFCLTMLLTGCFAMIVILVEYLPNSCWNNIHVSPLQR